MRGICNTILAAGTALWLIAPASAQDVDAVGSQVAKNLREVDMLEGALRDAEKYRLAGDCESMKWIVVLFLRRVQDRPMSYLTSEGPPADLPQNVRDEFERRMLELVARECPPGSGMTLRGTPVAQPGAGPTPEGHEPILDEIGDDTDSTAPDRTPAPSPQPPVTVVLPPVPDSDGAGDCPGPSPLDGMSPVCPGGSSAAPAGTAGGTPEPPTPEGFEPILDELEGDPTASQPDRGPPPPPPRRKPEEVHVPPKPTASSSGPLLPARGDILDGMAPLRAELGAAIANCDPAAFKAAKNRLLEAIGQLLTRFPGNIHLLAERRRVEETQLPRPCPPE